MLTITDPRIGEFLTLAHENGRVFFESYHKNLNYDSYEPKTAKNRRKYIALDRGTSGWLLIDKTTEVVFSIKAYGVPNYRVGTLDSLIAEYRDTNEHNRMMRVA